MPRPIRRGSPELKVGPFSPLRAAVLDSEAAPRDLPTKPETRTLLDRVRQSMLTRKLDIRGTATPALEYESLRLLVRLAGRLEDLVCSSILEDAMEQAVSVLVLHVSAAQPYFALHYYDPPSTARAYRRVVVREPKEEFRHGVVVDFAAPMIDALHSWSITFDGRPEQISLFDFGLACRVRLGFGERIELPALSGLERLQKPVEVRDDVALPGRKEFLDF